MTATTTIPATLEDLAVSDTGFVFDPHTGSTFSVNEAGLAVLDGLRRGSDRSQLLAALAERFDLPPGVDLERDLDEFLRRLRRNALLPEEFTP